MAALSRQGNGIADRRGRWARSKNAIYRLLASRLQGRLDQKHLRLLAEVEENRLQAAGMNLLTARRRGRRIASALVLTAAQWRDEQRLLSASSGVRTSHGPPLWERLSRAASQPEPVLEPHEKLPSAFMRRLDSWAEVLLSRALRLVLAVALLIGFAMWLDAKKIITAGQVREQAAELYRVAHDAARAADPGLLRELKWTIPLDWRRMDEALGLDWLPVHPSNQIHGVNVAGAALILVASTFSPRRVTALLGILGAAVALFGAPAGLLIPGVPDSGAGHVEALVMGIAFLVIARLIPTRKLKE
jgi:hypothetical protein